MDPTALVAPPPADTLSEDAACLDCGTALVGPYCHACGQRDQRPDLPLRRLAEDLLGDLFAWDGRVFQTARMLFASPGTLSLDWAAGRRARHVAPFRLYLLCSLVFLAMSATYSGAQEVVGNAPAETEAEDRAELAEGLATVIPVAKIPATVRYLDAMVGLGSRWMFVLMPLGGFGLFVLYHHRKPTYTSHFIVAIHVFCVVILALAVRRLIQLGVLLSTGETLKGLSGAANNVVILALFGVSFVYAALAIRRFYGVSMPKAFASAPAVTVGPIAAWFGLFSVGFVLILAWPA